MFASNRDQKLEQLREHLICIGLLADTDNEPAYINLLCRLFKLPTGFTAVQGEGYLQSLKNSEVISIKIYKVYDDPSRLFIQHDRGQPGYFLVNKEDLLFVSLYLRANQIVSNCKDILLSIKTTLQMGNISIQEASRQIAVKLYEQLPHLTKENQLEAKRVIVSYLQSEIDLSKVQGFIQDDFKKSTDNYRQKYFPLTADDYIFYNLRGELDQSFYNSMCDLLLANWVDLENLKEVDANQRPFHDERLHQRYIPAFIKAVNDVYRALDDDSKKQEVRQFIDKIKQFNVDVCELQAKLAQLERLPKLAQQPQEQSAGQQLEANTSNREALNESIRTKSQSIKDQAETLKGEMFKLFDSGIPPSKRRKVWGAVLMILGVGLMIAGVAAMIVPPVGVVSLAAGAGMTAIGVGGVTFGGLLFFKRNREACKTAEAIIDYGQTKALKK